MLGVVLFLAALAAVFFLLRWRRAGFTLLALTLILFLAGGCGVLPKLMADDLQAGFTANVPVNPAKATAIVLLGAGTEQVTGAPGKDRVEIGALAFGRIVETLQLYQACKRVNSVCYVLITGGDPPHHGASEAAVYGARLVRLGVAPADLLLEERSLNTFQNAQYTAPILQAHGVDQVLLVSSGMHLRRALLYFGHFGVVGRPARADYVSVELSVIPMSYNFLVADLAVHEYIGVARYYIYQFMGLNVQAKKPGSP
jgi:uncharacterized SAM-binding protein YcdF (DUF218 family)